VIIRDSNDEMMDSASSLELFKQIPNEVLTYYPGCGMDLFICIRMFVEQANFFLNFLNSFFIALNTIAAIYNHSMLIKPFRYFQVHK
jgi:hypothetical protein